MSDNKETKKKGFFSKLFGGSDNADASNELEKNAVIEDSKSLPQAEEASSASGIDDVTNAITEPSKNKVNTLSKSVLSKMKKADIVLAAAELGLELDIKLTKVKLLESWNEHFNQHEIAGEPAEEIAEEPVAEAVAEEPAEEIAEEPAEEVAETPVEEVVEETAAEEAEVEEVVEEAAEEEVSEDNAEVETAAESDSESEEDK